MIHFDVTVKDDTGRQSAAGAALKAIVESAFNEYGRYIDAPGTVTLTIQINAAVSTIWPVPINLSAPVLSPATGGLLEPVSITQLRGGTPFQGATSTLTIGENALSRLWLDPTPNDDSESVPAGLLDARSLVLQLMSPMFGQSWHVDWTTLTTNFHFPGREAYQHTLDALLGKRDGITYLDGPTIDAMLGGPITDLNVFHDAARGYIADPWFQGTAVYLDDPKLAGRHGPDPILPGERLHLTALDLAFIKDTTGLTVDIPASLSQKGTVVVQPWSMGSATDEVRIGTAASERIDLVGGRDTIVEPGKFADAQRYLLRDGIVQIDTAAGGSDLLHGVERIRFDDGVLLLDAGTNAYPVWRLYKSLFGRTPDEAGLRVQTAELDHGVSLNALAQRFLDAPEFIARYGSAVNDSEYVTLLYRNVLLRDPDLAGLANQMTALQNGTSRVDMLVNFSESLEHWTQNLPALKLGMFSAYPDIALG